MVQIWRRRWEFEIRSPHLIGTCVFLTVAAALLFIAGRLREDARRFDTESIAAPVVATRFIPAVAKTSTVFEVTYRPAAIGAGPDPTEAVPLALWEAARIEGRVRLKRTPEGDLHIWQPTSTTAVVILAAVGVAMLVTALAIAVPGVRAWARARRGLPPRPSFTDRVLSRVSFWTLFGSIWLTVGLPFLLMTAFFAWQDWRLSTSGQTVNGLVLEKEVTRSGKTPSGPTFRHSVRYRFAGDGRTHEGTGEVTESTWSALVERQPVSIEHVPGRLSLHRIAGTNRRMELAIFGGIGLLIGGAGALIIRADWRRRRRVLRLQRTGVRAVAKVVSVEPSGLRVNREHLWTLRYEYRDNEHRVRQGRAQVTAEDAERWKEGDSGAILFDPAAPRSTVWIGDATELPA